jgi:penicillin-binding protein 1A
MKPLFKAPRLVIGILFAGFTAKVVTLFATCLYLEPQLPSVTQVARNFFLGCEKTFTRKLKEIFLALKINRELTKQEVLDLYLDKIYPGNRAYGVGAAARIYYGKNLDRLSPAQITMIAGLPKAPSRDNPDAVLPP